MKSKTTDFMMPRPLNGLIGHRGVAAHAPENTHSGLRLAKDMGLTWVEIDVRQTRSGDLIIFHDPTLERTTNGSGEVEAYDLASLKLLDAGAWFSPTFKGEQILTLKEALDSISALDLMVNLEIKCPKKTPIDQIKKFALNVHRTIELCWPKNKPLPLVSSFNLAFIRNYRQLSPVGPVGVLTKHLTDEVLQTVKSIPNCMLHCGKTSLNPAQVREVTDQGIHILVYTVNDKNLGRAYLDAGAFGLFIDSPDHYKN